MKYTTLLGAILLIALVITACSPAAANSIPTQIQPVASAVVATVTQLAVTPSPAATETPAVVNTQAATTPAASGISSASVPVTGETTVKATLSDQYGPILANGDDIAVYIYAKDTQNGDKSACTDTECTSEWSPLTTQGAPVAGAGAIQSMLGTITRDDGTMQVTYNGWPLYLFSGDSAAGDTNGTWYLHLVRQFSNKIHILTKQNNLGEVNLAQII
jgi:predicted lipoprotein with Yx(FWY)xxD motif